MRRKWGRQIVKFSLRFGEWLKERAKGRGEKEGKWGAIAVRLWGLFNAQMHNQGWLSSRLGGRAGGGFVRLNQHFYTLRALNPPLPLQGGDNVRLLGAYSLNLGLA